MAEAEKNDGVDALLRVVEHEYGNNTEFQNACNAYRQLTSQTGHKDDQDRIQKPSTPDPEQSQQTEKRIAPTQGDSIQTTIGEGAKNVAVGKNIIQIIM